MEKEKKVRTRLALPGWLLVVFMAVYGEVLLHLWTTDNVAPARFFTVTLFALAFGVLLGLLVSLVPGRGQKWTAVAVSFLLAVVYLTWYFINESFKIFMTISTILSGAEGVANGFMSTVAALLARDWWRIAMVLLPILLYAVFCRSESCTWKKRGILAGGMLAMYLLGFGSLFFVAKDQVILKDAYNFDPAVHAFGLNMALVLDLFHSTAAEEPEFVAIETEPPAETTEPEPLPEGETAPPEVHYEPNVYDIFDFEASADNVVNSQVAALHRYVAAQKPTMQNEYTGLFKGKNLIFISAEAFSREVIDPERTPTLYRMANKGIQFLDYYQPNWGGGTSGGEFANIIGFPGSGGCMMEATEQPFVHTMGYMLGALGYRSGAYHNNDYKFYHRDQTHTRLGYDCFVAYGNGMDDALTKEWPESDLEMFQFVMPQYLEGDQPFNLYFMSVSGHSLYNLEGNAMARKNFDVVKDLPYSTEVKCYLAANQELENAMAYLLDELEKAGIADDTVVVIAADHYPYGLEKSSTWGNTTDFLQELYGKPCDSDFVRDHNRLIIWSGCLEGMDLKVEEPTSSLDILPTLSNLFGLDYDSRLLVGRDVFSDAEPLVLWNNFNWKTDKGCYNPVEKTFIPTDGAQVDQAYIDRISAIVQNKLTYTRLVEEINYFKFVDPSQKVGPRA